MNEFEKQMVLYDDAFILWKRNDSLCLNFNCIVGKGHHSFVCLFGENHVIKLIPWNVVISSSNVNVVSIPELENMKILDEYVRKGYCDNFLRLINYWTIEIQQEKELQIKPKETKTNIIQTTFSLLLRNKQQKQILPQGKYLCIENDYCGVPLNLIKNSTFIFIVEVSFQLLWCLRLAGTLKNFTHGDIHAQNVLVMNKDITYYNQTTKKYYRVTHKVTLIDYELSRFGNSDSSVDSLGMWRILKSLKPQGLTTNQKKLLRSFKIKLAKDLNSWNHLLSLPLFDVLQNPFIQTPANCIFPPIT
ncbi:Protein kinase domain-containing protein [Entamoeba marina]